jgi:hypothetical protein
MAALPGYKLQEYSGIHIMSGYLGAAPDGQTFDFLSCSITMRLFYVV